MKRAAAAAYRTAVVPVVLNGADCRRSHAAAHLSARIWNRLVSFQRDFWSANRTDPTIKEMRHFVASLDPELLALHSHTKQAIVDDLEDVVATYRANRRAGRREAKAPWREKRYRPLTFTRAFGWKVSNERLHLSLGRGRPRISLAVPVVTEPATGKTVPVACWGEIKLCWDRDSRAWSLHIAVPTNAPPKLDPAKVLAIDEGIINPMTTAVQTAEGFEVTIINGRHARAIKRRRNVAVAGLRKKMAKGKKGSRQWRKYQRALKRAGAKATAALRNIDHQVSRKVAAVAQEHDTGTIVVGDVRGIEQKTKQVEKRRFGRDQRRRLSQWSRGQQEEYLAYKTGVELGRVAEHHSSKTCPACLTRHRPWGRNYRCGYCGFALHRDAVGAINILMRAKHGEYRPIDRDAKITILYRRATPLKVSARRKARNRATAGNSRVADQKRVTGTIPAAHGPTDRKIAVFTLFAA